MRKVEKHLEVKSCVGFREPVQYNLDTSDQVVELALLYVLLYL